MRNYKLHKKSFKQFKVMGISHGYRIKPLCKAEPEPSWSHKLFKYWDNYSFLVNMKCKKCVKMEENGSPLKLEAC